MAGLDPPLPERLRLARAEGHLTQADLAATLGVSRKTVDRWEHGDRPQPRHLAALAAFLGVSVQAVDPGRLRR